MVNSILRQVVGSPTTTAPLRPARPFRPSARTRSGSRPTSARTSRSITRPGAATAQLRMDRHWRRSSGATWTTLWATAEQWVCPAGDLAGALWTVPHGRRSVIGRRSECVRSYGMPRAPANRRSEARRRWPCCSALARRAPPPRPLELGVVPVATAPVVAQVSRSARHARRRRTLYTSPTGSERACWQETTRVCPGSPTR